LSLVAARLVLVLRFLFHDPAPTDIYTLSLHDALPISWTPVDIVQTIVRGLACEYRRHNEQLEQVTGEKITDIYIMGGGRNNRYLDRKSTRLNSSHVSISYAVFCLKKKKKQSKRKNISR